MRAVALHRADRVVLGEMVGESETHPNRGGELGAVAAGAEKPDRRQRDVRRHGMDVAKRMVRRKAAALHQNELLKALEEIVALARVLPAAQRVRRHRIGSRRAAEPEIDTAGKQRFQHLKSFGDHQRRMVHQHHAAGADAKVCRCRRDLPDHDVGR